MKHESGDFHLISGHHCYRLDAGINVVIGSVTMRERA